MLPRRSVPFVPAVEDADVPKIVRTPFPPRLLAGGSAKALGLVRAEPAESTSTATVQRPTPDEGKATTDDDGDGDWDDGSNTLTQQHARDKKSALNDAAKDGEGGDGDGEPPDPETVQRADRKAILAKLKELEAKQDARNEKQADTDADDEDDEQAPPTVLRATPRPKPKSEPANGNVADEAETPVGAKKPALDSPTGPATSLKTPMAMVVTPDPRDSGQTRVAPVTAPVPVPPHTEGVQPTAHGHTPLSFKPVPLFQMPPSTTKPLTLPAHRLALLASSTLLLAAVLILLVRARGASAANAPPPPPPPDFPTAYVPPVEVASVALAPAPPPPTVVTVVAPPAPTPTFVAPPQPQPQPQPQVRASRRPTRPATRTTIPVHREQ